MTYISLFDDIYIAAKLKSDTDIVKGYDTYALLATSTVKNTLTIATSNSKDWEDLTDSNPVISSIDDLSGLTGNNPGSGLKKKGTDQSLVFGLNAPFADVTSASSVPATAIPDNWGMIIMMNPKIKYTGTTLTINEDTPALSASA